MTRNPSWTRDEIVLALNLYFKAGRKWLPPDHRDVIELSQLLNSMPIHRSTLRNKSFRNPQGVSMKLGNFLADDPKYKGEGLSANTRSLKTAQYEHSKLEFPVVLLVDLPP